MSLGIVSSISRSTVGLKAYMPALARLLVGSVGFSVNPVTRPLSVDVHHATARRVLGAEDGQRCFGVAAPVEIDQGSQIEVRQIVGVDRQEELFVLHPRSMVPEGAGTAQELRLEGRADGRRPVARLQVLLDEVGQVVEVDQHLVHSGAMEGVEPEVEQRRASDGEQAFRGVVRDRPQPACRCPAASRKAFMKPPVRTTPRERMLAFAASRMPSSPSMSSSHSA